MQYHAPYPRIALIAFGFVVFAAVAAMLSGLGSRWGWWYFRTGFLILTVATGVGLVAALAEVWSALAIRGTPAQHIFAVALGGAFIGFIASGVPAVRITTAYHMPAIHDITTDIDNPPVFVAIMPLRKDAANAAAYGGKAVADKQRAAFPMIKPLILPETPAEAFPRALAEAGKMDWTIIDAKAAEGRIEATAETFWFGFKDDIVVRIRPDGNGSRVDVRSVSRVGLGDMGTNARRVMKYLVALGMET